MGSVGAALDGLDSTAHSVSLYHSVSYQAVSPTVSAAELQQKQDLFSEQPGDISLTDSEREQYSSY